MKLLFIGDLCLSDDVSHQILVDRHYDIWGNLRNLLDSSNSIVVGNVESSISRRGTPTPGKYATLRAVPDVVEKLDALDVALLGNNHVGDYGEDAAADTRELLNKAGITTTGYGQNLSESIEPAILSQAGTRLAIYSYCCLTTHPQQMATPGQSGVAPLSLSLIRENFANLSPDIDFRIVCLHWGIERKHLPTLDQIRIARRIIDCGADLVVGCHAHVIQPFEKYRGKWIFYGLGNFLFPNISVNVSTPSGNLVSKILQRPPRERESIGVSVKLQRDANNCVSLSTEPLYFVFGEELQPRLCDANELTININKLNSCLRISSFLQTHRLRGWSEMKYVTEFMNGRYKHFYTIKFPLLADFNLIFILKRLARALMKLVRRPNLS